MTSRNTYIIIAIAVVIVVGGGYYYYQQSQAAAARARALEVREQKWDDWASTLYLGTTSSLDNFHPATDIGGGSAMTIYNHACFPRLLCIDRTQVGQYNPSVAESWEAKIDADGDTYIEFKITPGLKFRDGTPINAQNVKWSFERTLLDLPLREKNGNRGALYPMSQSWGASPKGLVVEDDLTLRMYTNPNWPMFHPFWEHFLFGIGYGHMYSQTLGEQYAREQDTAQDAIPIGEIGGYGPFYLSDWVVNERVVLTADENFPVNPLGGDNGPSYSENIKTIVISAYADTASLRMALESGEIDSTFKYKELDNADFESLVANPDINVEYIPMVGSGNHLHMNFAPEFAPLNDTRVRRAIQYAIDPQEIVDKLMFGTADVSDSPVRSQLQYFKPVMKPIRDLPMAERIATAKQLLTDAGYPNGFTTQFWYRSGAAGGGVGAEAFNKDLGTIIQAQLAKIGITIELKLAEAGVYNDLCRAGQLPMFCRGWTLDYNDPDTELFYMLHSESSDQAKRINYNSSSMDALLVEGRQIYGTGNEARREEIYTIIQDRIVEEAIEVPLYVDGFFLGMQTWVKDYKPWMTSDNLGMGVWNAYKEIPTDWQLSDPPH